ncbi:MAG: hypothetical protein HXS45_13835, partial [Theionarchaea archaeon]|nr:hypothetical protein [Theionarchaea archaeon]
MIDTDESHTEKSFLHTKTRTELESDLEQCLERKRNLEEEKNALHNLKIDLETMLNQREEELNRVKSQAESVGAENERLQADLESLVTQKSSNEGVLEELNQRVFQIQQEKKELQDENERLRNDLVQSERDKETYKAYSEEAEKLLEVKTNKLQADLREERQVSQQLQREIEERNRSTEELRSEIQHIEEEKQRIKQQISTQEKMQAVNSEFMGRLSEKMEELQDLIRQFRVQPLEVRGELAEDDGLRVEEPGEDLEFEQEEGEDLEFEQEEEGESGELLEEEMESFLGEPETIEPLPEGGSDVSEEREGEDGGE